MSIISKVKSVWKRELQTFQSQVEENKELKKYETKWRDHSVYKDFDTNPLWLKTFLIIVYPPFLKNNFLWGAYAWLLFLAVIIICYRLIRFLFSF